jgi:ribosomal protein L7/L12
MILEILRTPRSFSSIDAILILRSVGGLSLKEAKAAVESAMRGELTAVSVRSEEVLVGLAALGVECRTLTAEGCARSETTGSKK